MLYMISKTARSIDMFNTQLKKAINGLPATFYYKGQDISSTSYLQIEGNGHSRLIEQKT